MELSARLYLFLVAAVALERLVELLRSHRNQQQLSREGSVRAPEPGFRWLVALHAGILFGAAAEILWLRRRWVAALGVPSLAVFLLATAVRWWAIRTLGVRWNVQVMSPSRLGVITSAGPYRWVRHPNYTAVFAELLALPLIHGAYWVALGGAVLHAMVLRQRVRLEESVLMQDPAWRAAFAHKARFIPGIA